MVIISRCKLTLLISVPFLVSIEVAPQGAEELLEFRLQAGHRHILEAPPTTGVLNHPLQSATELQ